MSPLVYVVVLGVAVAVTVTVVAVMAMDSAALLFTVAILGLFTSCALRLASGWLRERCCVKEGELGQGELGQGELGRGELGRGELGRSEVGQGGREVDEEDDQASLVMWK